MTTTLEHLQGRLLYQIEDLLGCTANRSDQETLILEKVSQWIDTSETQEAQESQGQVENFLPALNTFIGLSAGEHHSHYYNLRSLAVDRQTLFPRERQEAEGDIVAVIKNLRAEWTASSNQPLELLTLLKKYTWAVPVAPVLAQIQSSAYSLYYRQQMITALTETLTAWGARHGPLTTESLEHPQQDPFLLVGGRLEGSAAFILSGLVHNGNLLETQGRGFWVECLVRAAAHELLRQLQLSPACLLSLRPFQFVLLAPHLPETATCLQKLAQALNHWLWQHLQGSLYFNMATLPWSQRTITNFPSLALRLENVLDQHCCQPLRSMLPQILSGAAEQTTPEQQEPENWAWLGQQLQRTTCVLQRPQAATAPDNSQLVLCFPPLNQSFYLAAHAPPLDSQMAAGSRLYTLGTAEMQSCGSAIRDFWFTVYSRSTKRQTCLPASVDAAKFQVPVMLMTQVKDLNAIMAFANQVQGPCSYSHLVMMTDLFFSAWISKFLPPQVHTLFYGGDSFVVAGSWCQVLSFAQRLIREFKSYVGVNENLALAGMVIPLQLPQDPLRWHDIMQQGWGQTREKGGSYLAVDGHLLKWEGTDYECLNQLLAFGQILQHHLAQGLTRDFLYFLQELSQQYNIAGHSPNRMWIPLLLQKISQTLAQARFKEIKTILISDLMDQQVLLRHIDIPVKWALLQSNQ